MTRDEKERGELGFLARPSSQQPADTLRARTGTRGALLAQQTVPVLGQCQGGAGLVRMKEAVQCRLPDISDLMRTSWAGPPGQFEGPRMPERWLCRTEPVAKGSGS